MRHNNQGRKLGRTSAHRRSMLNNMVISLVEHERIQTTLQKAKEVRRVAEKVITLGKRNTLHARRLAFAIVKDESVVKKIFDVLGPRFAKRNGGYTRILRTGFRHGDNAEMSVIELVERTPKAEPEAKDAGEKAAEKGAKTVAESKDEKAEEAKA